MHPSECVVLEVTNNGDAPDGTKWDVVLYNYLVANGGLYTDAGTAANRFFAARSTVPTLGMVRGKAVIANNSFSSTAKVTGIDLTGFLTDQCGSTQNTSFLADPALADFGLSSHGPGSLVTFHYQGTYDDKYGGSDRAVEANNIVNTIRGAAFNSDAHQWYKTGTGRADGVPSSRAFALGDLLEPWPVSIGYNQIALGAVQEVAVTANENQRTVGTICGDFPNDTGGYIEAIYQRNKLVESPGPVGYDLASGDDKILPIDYLGTGHADHLICYRPGGRVFWVMRSVGGRFESVYQSFNGVGGYDLADARDLIVPLQTGGAMFFILLYRPGTGTVWILGSQASDGLFWLNQNSTTGLGGYDLASNADRIESLYSPGDGSSTAATLFCYRPGTGKVAVLRHPATGWNDRTWNSAFHVETGGVSPDFDFSDSRDMAFTLDYQGTGHRDHLVCYRPGTGRFAVFKWTGTAFVTVVKSTAGVPGAFPLTDVSDRVVPFDATGSGHLDSLLCYRWTGQPYLQAVKANPAASSFTPQSGGRAWLDCLDTYATSLPDQVVSFDFQSTGSRDHFAVYRPGSRMFAAIGNRAARPTADYGVKFWSAPGGVGDGVRHYDDASSLDVLFPYDYRATGNADHIVCRRSSTDSGNGQFWVLENAGGGLFHPRMSGPTGIPVRGGGSYDLRGGGDDRVVPFDAASSGKTTDLVAWRVGGICWVMQNNHDGTYTPVFQSSTGIADFDLKSGSDYLTAYDYDLTGAENHLIAYRSGTAEIGFLKRQGAGGFTDANRSHSGLPNVPQLGRVIPYDYTGTGHAQHLLCWGQNTFTILANKGPSAGASRFTVVASLSSVAGYGVTSSDSIAPFDYSDSGHATDLVVYRPGQGAVAILQNEHDGKGGFKAVYFEGAPGNGIAGWDLHSGADVIFGYDFKRTGSPDHLGIYRPGSGQVWFLEQLGSGYFHPVYCTGGGVGW
ncbi:hypothetical protein [Catenulispora yoronensis]|uniref:hypothetical protein n=1 Tax=Catenulispora yoronensis TaxID=450799 RepID=UPI0031DC4CE3